MAVIKTPNTRARQPTAPAIMVTVIVQLPLLPIKSSRLIIIVTIIIIIIIIIRIIIIIIRISRGFEIDKELAGF